MLTHNFKIHIRHLSPLSSLKQFSTLSNIIANNLQIKPCKERQVKPDLSQGLTFGKYHTDHMLSIDFDKQNGGWKDPQIIPYGPIDVSVTATSLHYGISCFEGISIVQNKKTGDIQAFRPRDHLQNLDLASEHLAMPRFDINEVEKCIKELALIDKEWFPENNPDYPDFKQLYMRIIHLSTDDTLGVKSPQRTKLLAFINPCQIPLKNTKVKCQTSVIKNWAMGHGAYRISGNFGPLIPSVTDAKNNGFDDCLWMIDDYIEELTTQNIFFLVQNRHGLKELWTPRQDGTIFNGTHRKSILALAKQIKHDKDVSVMDKKISIHELISAHQEDRLIEIFGASTASSIQPISQLVFKDESLVPNKGKKFTLYIKGLLDDIKVGDPSHPWVTSFK